MTLALFSQTPTLRAVDARGLVVRTVDYLRHPDDPALTEALVSRQLFGAHGFLQGSADPRLHESGLSNLDCLTDLAGQGLRTRNADDGVRIVLRDAARRPSLALTQVAGDGECAEDFSQAVTCTWQYEDNRLPGRLLSVTEQRTGAAAQVSERFVWGGTSAAEQAANLAGQCIRHYGPEGLAQTLGIALTGAVQRLSQRLLAGADAADGCADWQGEGPEAWDRLLDEEAWVTDTRFDALGLVLLTTDAQGHRHRLAHDLVGQLQASWLALAGGPERVIVKACEYSAAGQKLLEVHGNQVVSRYRYDPCTQRLDGSRSERPTGHPAGAAVLLALDYEYDPAGNVLRVNNATEAPRYWRNQQVLPQTRLTYDSLYRLASASGREMAASASPSGAVDEATYSNYLRRYRYDPAGNLTQIRHSAPATGKGFTTSLVVSERSNRALSDALAGSPGEVDALFTAGGQQKVLLPGQHLRWTTRGHLAAVTSTSGELQEHYRHDSQGQRVLKVGLRGGTSERVHYLPQLELRSTGSASRETRRWQVVVCGQVRLLHWESGLPAGVANDQLRFSHDDRLGSSLLELDEEGRVLSREEFYPYGGTAIWLAPSQAEADFKTQRYSGKERDATGLYYYGQRYYQPWLGRWLSADPGGTVDGLNLFRALRNNPLTFKDADGRVPEMAESVEQDNATPASDFMSLPHREILYRDPCKNEFNFMAIDLGEHYRIYLDRDGPSENLVITADGAAAPWLRDIPVPEGKQFGFFGPHGQLLLDPGISNLARGSNKVFVMTDGTRFEPRKQAARDLLAKGRTDKLSGSSKPGFIADYNLFRFEDDDEDVVTRVLSLNRSQDAHFRFDVLTVRNRKAFPAVLKMASLSGALRSLEKHGFDYRAILASFCRGVVGRRARTFDPAQARDV